jgi:hypothetical protein
MAGRKRTFVVIGAAALAAAGLALAQPAPSPAPPQEPVPPAAEPPAVPEAEEPPPPAVPPVIAPAPAPPVPEAEIAPIPQAVQPKPRAAPEAPKPPPAPKRALYNAAVIQALDKVTTERLRFEAPLNQPVRYKGLIFTVHTCQGEPAGSHPPFTAHMEVVSQPLAARGGKRAPAKTIFRGWMFAEAPGLHPLEHPVYDAWLIACKTASPPANPGSR